MKILKVFSYAVVFIEDRWHLHIFPAKTYLKAAYIVSFNRRLNLKYPKSFTEKLQWMKIYDCNPLYTVISDKKRVKEYIKEIVGEEYIIPSLGCWDKVEDIQIDELPTRFVIKCTHDSRSTLLVDKTTSNWRGIQNSIRSSLRKNYYFVTREWCYKNIVPKVIVEPFLQDRNGLLWDYKFFCFDGKVRFFKIDFERFKNHRANYYDTFGNYLDFGEAALPRDPNREVNMPEKLPEMIRIAEQLSSGFNFLRVDMYYVDGEIKVGELTVYPGSGLLRYDPDEWDYKIGEYLSLPGQLQPNKH